MEVPSGYIAYGLYRIGRFFRFLAVDLADPRTVKWPLMGDPTIMIAIAWFYVIFIIKLGPAFMKNREPFKLQKTIVIYNFLQVLISAYLSYDALTKAFLSGDYSLRCEPVNWTRSMAGMVAARGCYLYFLAKITELLDTVFFVLRKKFNQITFLHMLHHIGMVGLSYGVTKYYPGGNIIFYGMINSMVHTVMYTYYMISAMGPQYQKYLWWKKYITVIQLIQFFIGVLHGSQLLFIDCGFPKWVLWILIPNGTAFYFLFYDFYNAAYTNKKKNLSEKVKVEKDFVQKTNETSNAAKHLAPPNGVLFENVEHVKLYFAIAVSLTILYIFSYPHGEPIILK